MDWITTVLVLPWEMRPLASQRKASSQGLRGGGWGQLGVFESLIIPIGSAEPLQEAYSKGSLTVVQA